MAVLKIERYPTGSQCNFLRSGVVLENLVCLVTILARVFCTPCSFSIFAVDRLLKREWQWSRRLLTSAFAIKMAHSSDTNCLIHLKLRNWTKQHLQIFRTWAVLNNSILFPVSQLLRNDIWYMSTMIDKLPRTEKKLMFVLHSKPIRVTGRNIKLGNAYLY